MSTSTLSRTRPHGWLTPAAAALVVAGVLVLVAASAAADDEPDDEFVQYPFACTLQDHGLGQPVVDNQDGEGVPVYEDWDEEAGEGVGEIVGYSRDCEAEETRYWYYAVTADGDRVVVRDHGEDAPDVDGVDDLVDGEVATTELTTGETVPYLIRHERGTINRFIYSVSMLAPEDEVLDGDPTDPDRAHWNGRLVYQFQGGVGIGHTQGRYSSRGITARPDRLSQGYAVIYSTGTRTGDHYNLTVGGETAVAVKDRFVDVHGEPDYTVGIGGSGGGIQQYVYAQNHPGLLDAAIPQRSYPDMTTQTIHVGDCALLERWMDVDRVGDPTWQDWDNRQWLQGLHSQENFLERFPGSTGGELAQLRELAFPDLDPQTGSSECLEGWFGLSALALNPHFGAEANWDLLSAEEQAEIERTHWDDARNVYGTDPDTGFARVPWDNVGVQYGLRAVADGRITPEQFLDLNARVGSWADPEDMEQEGFPFVGSQEDALAGEVPVDPWSSHNMRLSPDGGETPAPRREGDVAAIEGAYEHGLVFTGDLEREIPIVDVREYMEHVHDMHNVHQSFAARERLLDGQGHADNQLIWFLDTDAEGDSGYAEQHYHDAFDLVAEWMANLDDDPGASVAEARPDGAADQCRDVDGSLIAAGEGVWDGAMDPDAAQGDCAEAFEIYTQARIEAGGPVGGDVYKCETMPVATAVAEGLYGDWTPGAAAMDRLEDIHPDGVCDYDLPDVGDPSAEVADAPGIETTDEGVAVSGAEPGAEVQVRLGGEVVDTATADDDGAAAFGDLGWGEPHVAAQTVDGQRSRLSEPASAGVVGERLAGADRVETAIAIAAATFPDGADTAVLTTGDVPADSLAAAPLSAAVEGPLLLTRGSEIEASVLGSLDDLGVDSVEIVGGEAAVPAAVAADLEDAGYEVERHSGADRYATAAEVAALVDADGGALLAASDPGDPGVGWPDALGAGAYAGLEGAPIVLTRTDELPEASREALEGREAVEIVGGEAVVSAGIADEVAGLADDVIRHDGVDRWETSVAIADAAVDAGADVEAAWVATGRNWPDGLTAGAAAAAAGGPLVLVDGSDLDASAATRDWLREAAPTTLRLAGGPAAIDAPVAMRLGVR